MQISTRSIRTFIGCKDFAESRAFYQELGFTEIPLGEKMSYFRIDQQHGFYLQKYYIKDWVDNSMVFLEVEDLDRTYADIAASGIADRYPKVRLIEIQDLEWGREFFLHDPAGVLWHIGTFKSTPEQD